MRSPEEKAKENIGDEKRNSVECGTHGIGWGSRGLSKEDRELRENGILGFILFTLISSMKFEKTSGLLS